MLGVPEEGDGAECEGEHEFCAADGGAADEGDACHEVERATGHEGSGEAEGERAFTGGDSGHAEAGAGRPFAEEGGAGEFDVEAEGDGEEEREERSGEGDDDFVESRDGGQGFCGGGVFSIGLGFAFALDEVHRGELGEFDEAACWYGPEGIPDAVELFFPEGFAEPNAELLDVESAPASGEEVSDFVDDDDEVEEQDDAACGGDDVEQFGEHGMPEERGWLGA